MSPFLEFRHVAFAYPARDRRPAFAIDDLSFSVDAREIFGIIGPNASGKTTLIRLLSKVLSPARGEILLDGETLGGLSRALVARRIAVVPQDVPSGFPYSVEDLVLMGRFPHAPGRYFESDDDVRAGEEAMTAAGVLELRREPIDRLSGGERQRVMLARALCQRSSLLVLDEPTATLTPPEIERLFAIIRKLRARGVTIIYISHRLHEIFEIGDRVSVLRNGKVVATRAVGELTIADIVRLMVGREIDEEYIFDDRITPGDAVLRVTDLRHKRGMAGLSFEVRRREILGVAGLVGSGRTEAMRAAFGADPKASGTIELNGVVAEIESPKDAVRNGLCLLTEDRKGQGLLLDLPCDENITITDLRKISRLGILNRRTEDRIAGELVGNLRIRMTSLEQLARNLSGGNQQKLVLAKWLFRGAAVLILDEPPRGVDVGAKREIYRLLWLLAADGKGIIVVSSDLPELIGICHRIIVFSKNRIVGELQRAQFNQERILSLAYQEYLQS